MVALMALQWAFRQPFGRAAIEEVRRAWPLALLLAVALGTMGVLGAHLSNAFPYEQQPFGWPGPSSFENGVAMVRPQLVLAASIPGLILGLRTLRPMAPGSHSLGCFVAAVIVDILLVWAAVALAGGIGVWGAREAKDGSYAAFTVAHALLALAFYSVGVLATSALPRHGAAVAGGVWVAFAAVYEQAVQLRLFREVGYHGLTSGQFPTWFFVAQALSPLAAYRAILILWQPGFMDYLERTVLADAPLPPWLTPPNLVAFMVALWVVLPLMVAAGVWTLRRRWARRFRTPDQAARPAVVSSGA